MHVGCADLENPRPSPYSPPGSTSADSEKRYHDEDQTLVLEMNQAAIDGIRAAGATSQYIAVEGNSYSGAWTWTDVNTNLANLTDSGNKILYEMHQYLDSDGSGTSDACVSATIGVERITSATAWLRANGKVGILGEFAGGANAVCEEAVAGMLDYMRANSDVWLGGLWWAGGPWWGMLRYMSLFSFLSRSSPVDCLFSRCSPGLSPTLMLHRRLEMLTCALYPQATTSTRLSLLRERPTSTTTLYW